MRDFVILKWFSEFMVHFLRRQGSRPPGILSSSGASCWWLQNYFCFFIVVAFVPSLSSFLFVFCSPPFFFSLFLWIPGLTLMSCSFFIINSKLRLLLSGMHRSGHPEVLLGKGILKICSKFTGEHPCRSVTSIKLHLHGCSPVNLLHVFRTPFLRSTSGWLLLYVACNDPVILRDRL